MAATTVPAPFATALSRGVRLASPEPAWLAGLRRRATEQFAGLGLPTRRQEAWRFTSLAPVSEHEFAPLGREDGEIPGEVLHHLEFAGSDRLVLINGEVAPELSAVAPLPEGVVLAGLRQVLEARPELLEPWLGGVAAVDAHAFAALNTALFADGAVLLVPPGTVLERPVHLLHVAARTPAPGLSLPRCLVVVGENAQATVVETYAGAEGVYLTAPVTEVVLGAAAVLRHVREQREGRGGLHLALQQARQSRGSTFESTALSIGARLARLDLVHELAEEGATAVLNGLYLGEDDQHTDTHMRVEHAAPHCESHELYKGVLDGRSSAVFNGLIHVHPGAQKTNAKQSNRNLLLSRTAQANSNPQLEIFADDVKCTHGSTVGQLDENAIFYLRSRGIGEAAARSILTYAFAAEVVEGIRVDAVRSELQELLFNRLPQGEIVRQAV